jgi:hypothetical protein
MLNSPHRNAKETASAVRMSGIASLSVCWRCPAAAARSLPWTHGKNQLKPAPLKIAR